MLFFKAFSVRCGVCLLTLSLGLILIALVSRFCIVPILVFLFPNLYNTSFDLGVYGWYIERHYHSSNLTSPTVARPRWTSPVCDSENESGGLILRDLHGTVVKHNGPTITDLKGDLIWTDESYGHASNLKVQTWRGDDYLTFWAGNRSGGNGQGKYYMLDNEYNVAKIVSAVGKGLYGDLHEFEVTTDDTALITIFDQIDVDLGAMYMPHFESNITDAIVQEVNIASGELLFEWRAFDHLSEGEYLRTSHASRVTGGGPFDYFHINSIQKDLAGNYIVSLRFQHLVICISGKTGEILWGLGGDSQDFEDLSYGKATDFQWQHDARWIDEERGIFGLFNNGVSKYDLHAATHSEGRIIYLDVENKTARLLHSYISLDKTRSIHQGSFQYHFGVEASSSNSSRHLAKDQVFIGWGSSAAWSLFDAESERLLCETHFAASLFFPLALANTYRATRAPPGWKARPAKWDPTAVIKSDKIYISWNGGMEVMWWVLQRAKARKDDIETLPEELIWEDVEIVRKDGFETCIDVPQDDTSSSHRSFRVLALDANLALLRQSNVIHAELHARHAAFFWLLTSVGFTCAVVFFHLSYCKRRLSNVYQKLMPRSLFHRQMTFVYAKLESSTTLDTLQPTEEIE